MIFKIQLPLETDLEIPQCFVYNKDRSVQFFFPLTEDIIEVADGSPKIFIEGEYDGQTLHVHETGLEDPGW
jgi:hypothetical protein